MFEDLLVQVEGLKMENLVSKLLALLIKRQAAFGNQFLHHLKAKQEIVNEVDTEVPLGGGRVDILIETPCEVVIVENKIFKAEFQENQPQKYLKALSGQGKQLVFALICPNEKVLSEKEGELAIGLGLQTTDMIESKLLTCYKARYAQIVGQQILGWCQNALERGPKTENFALECLKTYIEARVDYKEYQGMDTHEVNETLRSFQGYARNAFSVHEQVSLLFDRIILHFVRIPQRYTEESPIKTSDLKWKYEILDVGARHWDVPLKAYFIVPSAGNETDGFHVSIGLGQDGKPWVRCGLNSFRRDLKDLLNVPAIAQFEFEDTAGNSNDHRRYGLSKCFNIERLFSRDADEREKEISAIAECLYILYTEFKNKYPEVGAATGQASEPFRNGLT